MLNDEKRSILRRLWERYRFITSRQTAYQRLFSSVHAEPVLRDLAWFCRAGETTWHEDSRASALLEGRREVWLRIQDHLQLSPDELYKLSTGQDTRDFGQMNEVSTDAPE